MNTVPKHLEDAFYAGVRLPELPFVLNDSVEVVRGQHVGRSGAVISILETNPELLLLIEFGDTGNDAHVAARDLRCCSVPG